MSSDCKLVELTWRDMALAEELQWVETVMVVKAVRVN